MQQPPRRQNQSEERPQQDREPGMRQQPQAGPARANQGGFTQPGPRGEEGQPRRPGGGSGDPSEGHRRLHHLEIAIDNLRAAGMNEAAQHISQEARRLRERIESGNNQNNPPPMDRQQPREGGMGRDNAGQQRQPGMGQPGVGQFAMGQQGMGAGPNGMRALREELEQMRQELRRLNESVAEMRTGKSNRSSKPKNR